MQHHVQRWQWSLVPVDPYTPTTAHAHFFLNPFKHSISVPVHCTEFQLRTMLPASMHLNVVNACKGTINSNPSFLGRSWKLNAAVFLGVICRAIDIKFRLPFDLIMQSSSLTETETDYTTLHYTTLPYTTAGTAQSVQGLAARWTVRGSKLGGDIFRTRSHRPWSPPNILYNW
jgi:hypothetical protein